LNLNLLFFPILKSKTAQTQKKHHPPPKKNDSSSHRTYDYSNTNTNASNGSSTSASQQQQSSSGYMMTGMAAVAVVGVAAMYHKQNRNIATPSSHPLQGSVAKRMERFHNLAGLASPRDRGDTDAVTDNDCLDTESGTMSYVNMEMSSQC
jgi:hypothetical protein